MTTGQQPCPEGQHTWERVWPPKYVDLTRTKTRGAPMFTCTTCGEPGWEIDLT